MQSQYFAALLQGKVKLPSYQEMIAESNTLPGGARDNWHALGSLQWTYNKQLAKAAGFQIPPVFYRDGARLYETYRDAHLANFREVLFRFNSDGTFRLENIEQ